MYLKTNACNRVQFKFVQKMLQEYSQDLLSCSTKQLSFLSTVLVKLPKIFVSPFGMMRIVKISSKQNLQNRKQKKKQHRKRNMIFTASRTAI